MSNVAVRVEGLGKMYRIGGKQERYATLRDTLTDAMAAPFKRARSLLRGEAYGAAGLKEEIWALKDVSFEVKHGEVVGIIGRNGAGKSTLLKILSRITEPTEGYAEVYGRVGSLLEVGTGFHPELTGRENIYLNGAILGMSRAEIDRKFDEIVDFAEIERFIDTPVKHYSSGMGLRLGFAVAAHLEPEILIVDEVLAVGDAEFQKKCLGKMSDVAGAGRTVLFVSHNMSAVVGLCTRAFWLDQGVIRYRGNTVSTVQNYLYAGLAQQQVDLAVHPGRRKGKQPLLQRVRLLGEEDAQVVYKTNSSFAFEVECRSIRNQEQYLSFTIFDSLGRPILDANMRHYKKSIVPAGEIYKIRILIDSLPLGPGIYYITLYVGSRSYDLDIVDNALRFEVIWDDDIPVRPPQRSWGPLFVPVQWETEG